MLAAADFGEQFLPLNGTEPNANESTANGSTADNSHAVIGVFDEANGHAVDGIEVNGKDTSYRHDDELSSIAIEGSEHPTISLVAKPDLKLSDGPRGWPTNKLTVIKVTQLDV